MSATDVRFAVRLTPRAAVDRVDGVTDGVLRARVGAPAVEGAANNALIRLIAEELGVARSDVRIVAGVIQVFAIPFMLLARRRRAASDPIA